MEAFLLLFNIICNSFGRPVVLFRWKRQNIFCFTIWLEGNISKRLVDKTATRGGFAPAAYLRVILNINMSAVIRKIAKEAVSPSLSSFQGHFAAQRQTPQTFSEGPARLREGWQWRDREEKPWSLVRPHTGFCRSKSKSPQSHWSLPMKLMSHTETVYQTPQNTQMKSKSTSTNTDAAEKESWRSHTQKHGAFDLKPAGKE